jgi:Glucodextranase, domain B/FecR protein
VKRSFALAAVLVLALLGAGFLLSRGLFDGEGAPAAATPVPPPAPAVPEPPAVTPPPVADAAPSSPARVASASGSVERRPAGGDWVPAQEGDRLAPSDGFRTGAESAAVLEIGAGTRVEVTEETGFTVSHLTDTVSGLRLEGGRIAARVEKGTGSELRVEVADGDAVAETDEGEFTALSSGHGDLSVAATEGKVRLSARGKSVEVAAGQQSSAAADEAPSEPRAIPSSLFLKVNRPGDRLRKREVRLAGATSPGAVVTVNGVPVRVDPSGRFEAEVALREGRNRVLFRAVDPVGREQKQRVPLRVDSKGPGVKSEVRWR